MECSIKSQFENAERYLIAVLQKGSKLENFDELRYELYIDKSKSLTELAPTSLSIRGHLSRCYYIVHNSINVLKVSEALNPVMYGWKSTQYTITCNCKIRCAARRKCVKSDVFCTISCKCRNQKCGND